jgi:hypothetical protein
MKYLKEVKDFDIGYKGIIQTKKEISDEDIEKQYLINLGKKGELIKYLKKDTTQVTFGVFKDLFKDAISYKSKREYIKGSYKFVHRTIPTALGPIVFPVWLIGKILGTSRAINKIISPVLKLNNNNYSSFMVNIIMKTMSVMEGEIKYILGRDWFYDAFYMDWGLIKMVRKEHLLEFARYLSEKMEREPDDKLVPSLYVENQFRMWLNNKFNLHPALPLKRVFKNPKRTNY